MVTLEFQGIGMMSNMVAAVVDLKTVSVQKCLSDLALVWIVLLVKMEIGVHFQTILVCLDCFVVDVWMVVVDLVDSIV